MLESHHSHEPESEFYRLLHATFVVQRVAVSFLFFQAEDVIRDIGVTGVQTCALPIFPCPGCRGGRRIGQRRSAGPWRRLLISSMAGSGAVARRRGSSSGTTTSSSSAVTRVRSEERRVGKGGRSRWSPYH